jgi:uncharacterized protein (DUF1778 family)
VDWAAPLLARPLAIADGYAIARDVPGNGHRVERGSGRALRLRIDSCGILPYIRDMAKNAATARLEARLPADVYALLKRAAEIQGRTLTDFVVGAARAAASRTIEESAVLRLSVEGQRQFAEAILNPPAPNAALQRAARRYRELFGS